MSFSYANGVITQTATDTDPIGAVGLTGVTDITYGADPFSIIDFGTNRLDIEGDLTINPEDFLLASNATAANAPNAAINVRAGGTLTLGAKTVVGTATKYTTGLAIVATERGNLNSQASIYVEDGGTLNAYGADIQAAGIVKLANGSYINVESLTVTTFRNGPIQVRIEHSGTNTSRVAINNNGLTLNGKDSTDSARLTTTGGDAFSPSAFIFNFSKGQYQPAAAGYPNQVFLDFDNGNNVDDFDFAYAGSGGAGGIPYNGNLVDFRNVARRLRYTNANTKGGFSKTTKVVNFNLLTQSGAALSGVSYYSVDVDNGNRINFNSFDSTADIVYQGQNVGPSLEVIPTVEFMAGESTTRFIDDRTSSGTLTFKFVSYLTSIATPSPNLIGLKTLSLDVVNPNDTSISAAESVVAAYTETETSAKVYDALKIQLVSNYAYQDTTFASRSGILNDYGAYDVEYSGTGVGLPVMAGNKITVNLNGNAFVDDSTTTGLITLINGAVYSGTRTDANGTVFPDKPLSITNISAGSRIQLYNTTTTIETVNTVVVGTTYSSSYQEGVGYSVGDLIRIRVKKLGKQDWSGNVVATSSGFNVLVEQADNTIYTTFGIDGSLVTNFAADYIDNDVDLVIGANWTMKELYAWWEYNLTTELGIRNFFGGITAVDEANFKINTSIVNLFLDNTTNASYRQTDNRRFFRDSGDGYPVKDPTTSGYGLDAVWRDSILISNIADIPTVQEIRVEMDGNSTKLIDILADTDEINSTIDYSENDQVFTVTADIER